MTAHDVLRRRYRWLLLAYPVWHRRERGLEMLTTMLDSAEPGRRWPALGDVLDILRGGLRSRLRPPRGAQFAIVTGIVAVFAALAGSTIAAQAATPTPPTEAQAAAVAHVATGTPPVNLPGPDSRCNYYCYYEWVPGGDQVVTFDEPFEEKAGIDQVTIVYWVDVDDLEPTLATARQRLTAQGWQVGEDAYTGPVTHFTARKDGLSVRVASTPEKSLPPFTLQVEHEPGASVAYAALAGLLGGLLIGRLLAVWVLQRHRRHRRAVWVPALVWGAPTLLIMVFLIAQTANYLVAVALGGASVPLSVIPVLPAFAVSGLLFHPVITWTVAVVVLGNLLPAALPIRKLPPQAAMAPVTGGPATG